MADVDTDAHIDDLGAFIAASPTSYHAADEVRRRLVGSGWSAIAESDDWGTAVRPGARIVVVRDGAVVAVAIPADATGSTPLRVLGAHTDSPALKLKPESSIGANGWLQAAVEVYGGPILASLFDRELELAGRVVTREGSQHLVRTGPLLRVPHLAIHLDRQANAGFTPDPQRDLQPVWGVGDGRASDVLEVVAAAAGVSAAEIAGADLLTCDTQPPQRFGRDDLLYAAPRMDNLTSVHAGLVALEAAAPTGAIAVLAAFDHEEVGSESRSGASGPLLADVLARVAGALGATAEERARALDASWCLSADAGHGVHPNRGDRSDPVVRPVLGGGPLLKINAKQRYTTDAVGQAFWLGLCESAGVPTQPFVSNNDVPCGSTIGPLTATRLGIRTLDVGVPLLSMHSARELCHVADPPRLAAAAAAFFA